MKRIGLLAVISLGIFALIGCGNTTEKANTGAPKEASVDKTFKVNELVEKLRAEKDTWKGKEVMVSGLVSQQSGHNVTLWNKKWDKEFVICVLPATIQESLGETAEVKGKISELTTQGENTIVKLEPCELKK